MARLLDVKERSTIVLIFISALFLLHSGECSVAQETIGSGISIGSAAEINDVTAALPIAPKDSKGTWRDSASVSVSFLMVAEALDSWTTYRNLTHRRWICGYSPAFGDAAIYISDDRKTYDQRTIQHDLCGAGPSNQLANYAYDVTRTGAFTETGWVTSMHLSGNRNIAGVLAWNIADDVGQMFLAHYLGRRRGLVGRMAPAVIFARGLVQVSCGIQNLQFAHTHNDASAWQFHVPNESTLYPGPRWWGRR